MNIFFLIISIILAVAIGFFFVMPLMDKMDETRVTLDQLREIERQIDRFDVIIEDLQTKNDAISDEDRKRLDIIIPQEFDSTRVALDLTELAESHGLELVGNVSISDAVRQGTPGVAASGLDQHTSDISITVKGSFTRLKSLLLDMTESLKIMDINAVTFSLPEDALAREYTFTIALSMYSFE